MGRKVRADASQRTKRVSNRELRMAAKSEKPPATFGIRRRLTFESQSPILSSFRNLLKDNEIPDTVIPRLTLHVTEMPKTKLDIQLSRGIVLGYEFGRRAVAIQHAIKEDSPDQVDVSLGDAAIFKGGALGYRVISEQLEEEYYGVREMVGRLGVKGTMRDVEPLHVTCGDVRRRLTRYEVFHALDAMNGVLTEQPDPSMQIGSIAVPRHVTLDPIEFYSQSLVARH